MIFRNEYKELMNALYLTKTLEDELDKNNAKGISLSDKVKSFETKTEENFWDEYDNYNDVSYQYRKYKRNLLGGNYNNLRWVAHERNQLMHQNGYFISNYKRFKHTLKNSIDYFKNGQTNSFNLRNFLITVGSSITFLIPFGVLTLIFKDKLSDNGSIIFIIFGIAIALQLGKLFSDLFKSLIEIISSVITGFGVVQIELTKNKKFIFLALLIIFLWNKDLNDLMVLLEHLEQL